jgi:hypothetical protein
MRVLEFRCLALVLALLATAGTAAARPLRMDTASPQITEFAGDQDNMPVNCRIASDQLIAFARTLHKVQAAMAEFSRLGYTEVPSGAYGIGGCERPVSTVAFVYRRAVTFPTPDSSTALLPMILVTTHLNETSGEPYTQVTAGVVALDAAHQTVVSADSLVGIDEHSFDVAQTGTPIRTREISRRANPEGTFDFIKDRDSAFNRWVWCTGLTAWSYLVQGIWKMGPSAMPAKFIAFVDELPAAATLIAASIAIASVQCLITVSQHP